MSNITAVLDHEDGNDVTLILAPADFHRDESNRSMPLRGAIVIDSGSWKENGFGTRENIFEDIFRGFY